MQFILNIENLSILLNKKLPNNSKISCEFELIKEDGIKECYLYARYRRTKYQIVIWVGDGNYFKYNSQYKFDVRVESCDGLDRFCEYEFNHKQNFEEAIDIAIQWIEKQLGTKDGK